MYPKTPNRVHVPPKNPQYVPKNAKSGTRSPIKSPDMYPKMGNRVHVVNGKMGVDIGILSKK